MLSNYSPEDKRINLGLGATTVRIWFPNLTSYSVGAKQPTHFLSRPDQIIYPVLTSLPERLLLRKEGHLYLFTTLI